jgi:hypothetical protein
MPRRDAQVSRTNFIIQRIEEKNDFISICYFADADYARIDATAKWTSLNNILVDSDKKEIIYVLDVDDEWVYIRFPVHTWEALDRVLAKEQDVMLVLSTTEAGEAHKTIPVKGFLQEATELVQNMHQNANYGDEMIAAVEQRFTLTLEKARA